VGNGQVMGIELELRQNLGAISGSFENFSINGNFTFTESQIAMSPTEYESREKNERIGETIVNTRDMAGQAPYIINAGLSYQGQRNGIQTGIYYNVQGETLQFVGIADKPDVYSLPFHSLNFNASRSFGKQDKMRLGIGLNNILGDVRESVFQSFGAKAQMFESINPRREFMINFGFSF
jgi:hypothetical protein